MELFKTKVNKPERGREIAKVKLGYNKGEMQWGEMDGSMLLYHKVLAKKKTEIWLGR